MVCYQSIPGGVQDMRFCGNVKCASCEKSGHEICASKHIHEYDKDHKERWRHSS